MEWGKIQGSKLSARMILKKKKQRGGNWKGIGKPRKGKCRIIIYRPPPNPRRGDLDIILYISSPRGRGGGGWGGGGVWWLAIYSIL